MKLTTHTLGACALTFALSSAASAATIGITEFVRDPYGTDLDFEYVELFNYGAEPVNLEGWSLKDNASTVRVLPNVVIPSGGYIISVGEKAAFETKWFGGVADDRVIAGTKFQLNQGGDGLYLRDAADELVWSLGYEMTAANPNASYRSTFLAVDDFTRTSYGFPPQDGPAYINFNGVDGPDAVGPLGYEGNEHTTDPFAWASYIGLDAETGLPLESPEFGSPLAGGYTSATPVPEPVTAGLLMIGAAGLLRRRAR